MYYDRETQIIFNHSVNEFYTRILFKIDALSQDVAFPLGITETFLNNLIPDVREFLIPEGLQFTPTPPTKNNHQGNQRLLLVINAVVEAENNTKTIKVLVQPGSGSHHTKTFIGTLEGNPSTQIYELGSSFQSDEINYMVAESIEEYALASAEAAYEDSG